MKSDRGSEKNESGFEEGFRMAKKSCRPSKKSAAERIRPSQTFCDSLEIGMSLLIIVYVSSSPTLRKDRIYDKYLTFNGFL